MNFTIGFEVVTAALLLICILAAVRQIMFYIQTCKLPPGALLGRYLGGGAFADCYVTEIASPVTHAEYVSAFYTTPVFKLERLILEWLVSRPSTDTQALQLATGTLDEFAAWSVESRSTDQLLLSDFRGRTRSWLMIEKAGVDGASGTRLYFGSAVVPAIDRKSDRALLGFTDRALLGFHKLYSRVLLQAAHRQLMHRSAREETRA
jgi:hypothetical protein